MASAYAAGVETLASGATRFELAEPDEQVAALFVATLDNPADDIAARAFSAVASERAAMAGKVMIEQSDLRIAIWDGVMPGAVGGNRHTMAAALNEGVAVLWIDAATPGRVRLLVVPEARRKLEKAASVPSEIEAIAVGQLEWLVLRLGSLDRFGRKPGFLPRSGCHDGISACGLRRSYQIDHQTGRIGVDASELERSIQQKNRRKTDNFRTSTDVAGCRAGGPSRNRTGVRGFAVLYVTTPPSGLGRGERAG